MNEIDITDHMLRFKDAVRHLWNAYFISHTRPTARSTLEAFEAIERSLFDALVLIPNGLTRHQGCYRRGALLWLHVRPIEHAEKVPIQLGRPDATGNVQWGHRQQINADQAEGSFIDYFDWDPYGSIDLHYVRFSPANAGGAPGQLALIEQQYCKFLVLRHEAQGTHGPHT